MGTTVTDPLVGKLVDGRYEVVSRIARGGMATVYLAIDRRLDRDVHISSLEYSQPSLTYYVGRRVERLVVAGHVPEADHERHLLGLVATSLDRPEPAYLFMPEPVWRKIEARIRPGVRTALIEAAAHYDFTRNATILVIWNGI